MNRFCRHTGLRTIAWTGILLAASVGSAGPAAAASKSSEARVFIRQPVTMTKTADLVFGDFATGTTDSIFRLNPRSGRLSKRDGDARSLGGTQSVASIEVFGTALTRVQLSTGRRSISIRRDGGTAVMRIDRFRFDQRRKTLDAEGEQSFDIGGQLRIGANQKPGVYRGSFEISVDYF